uniref:Uncharacterized protein n=1 Tax=Anguilla anguilla TaxID=7936 RepID=A0A0E9VUH7_ANGAN
MLAGRPVDQLQH